MVGINSYYNNKNDSIKNDTINNKNIINNEINNNFKNENNVMESNKIENINNNENKKIKFNEQFVQRIKPLYLCTEKEVTTYAFVNNILDNFIECPNIGKSYRAQVRDMLNDFEAKFPGTKYSIVNSFLQILPDLKQRFKNAEINYCSKCGEPAAKDKCNACKYVEKLNKAKNKPLINIK